LLSKEDDEEWDEVELLAFLKSENSTSSSRSDDFEDTRLSIDAALSIEIDVV
jgi:hypothetical protein